MLSCEMWILQNLLLAAALSCVSRAAAVIHVSGYEGRDVQVSCSYAEGYESYEKYLCRNDCRSYDVLILTTQAKKDKYSIEDDQNKRVLTTTISNLSSEDAGKYWCGVNSYIDYYPAKIQLSVEPDSCCDQLTNIHSYEEGSVSISCLFDPKYQNNLKYICRGKQPSTCLQQALITSNRKQWGHFTLTDDQESGKFTVTITNLTQKDSGPYLCGIQRNRSLDVFTAVELEVKDASHFRLLFSILLGILAGVSILIAFCFLVCKHKMQGIGAIMNINRSDEEMAATQISETNEYVDVASFNPQTRLHHNDNPDKDQCPIYQSLTTTANIYCSISPTVVERS